MRLATPTLALCLALSTPATAEDATALPPRPVVSEIVDTHMNGQRSFTGLVAARSETDLGFTVAGLLAERRASTGDVVAAGDVLALLDPTDLETTLRSANAGVRAAQAALQTAQDAERRAVELVARGVATPVQQTDAETARIAAEARLEQAQATAARAADQRAAATLVATADGVVTAELAEPGSTLTAGQPVLTFAATAAREVRIDVTEAELAGLSAGAGFAVALAVDSAVTARATLTDIAPTAARETRTRQLRLTLIDPPQGFRLGALVIATPEGSAQALTLPDTAILPGDAPAVWVINRPDGKVARVPVTIGDRIGGRTVILSGLTVGQEVAIRGINSLTDGQIVGRQVTQ